MPDGRRTLVIWRKRPGGETTEGVEREDLVLDEWFRSRDCSRKEFDLVFVNADDDLHGLEMHPIEKDFHRLMFGTHGI